MHNKYELLGEVIKNARVKADLTVEELASKVGATERYIYRIENEGKKPSYDILYKLIRELAVVPDQIFFLKNSLKNLKSKISFVCSTIAMGVFCRL